MDIQDIYAALGVKRRINAAGTLTRLGGALMDDEVLSAMVAAAGRLGRYQRAAGSGELCDCTPYRRAGGHRNNWCCRCADARCCGSHDALGHRTNGGAPTH